jgi:hypothetical protein
VIALRLVRWRWRPLVAALVSVCLLSCDPPSPPITLSGREYFETCVEVRREQLRPILRGVLGPNELAAARSIGGLSAEEAFAVRHDDFSRQCPHERIGEWFLVQRTSLSG